MTVLVTGGAGYVGSSTVNHLISAGEQVVVLDDLKRGQRHSVPATVPLYQGSIADYDLVKKIVNDHDIESCIHFAAMAYVGESIREPALYYENNVVQGIGFLKSLLDTEIRILVFSSSCAIYGEPSVVPIDESAPQHPTSPYGWSKLILEQVLAAYDRAYGLRSIALRYFNAAGATSESGEAHNPEPHLIPNVLSVAAGNQPEVEIFGDDYPTDDGTAVRDFVHVSDLADAHLRALRYLRAGGQSNRLNLSTGCGHSILEVVRLAEEITGKKIKIQMRARRDGDPARLVGNPTRAKSLLNWEPKQSNLRNIMLSAWLWYQERPKDCSGIAT